MQHEKMFDTYTPRSFAILRWFAILFSGMSIIGGTGGIAIGAYALAWASSETYMVACALVVLASAVLGASGVTSLALLARTQPPPGNAQLQTPTHLAALPAAAQGWGGPHTQWRGGEQAPEYGATPSGRPLPARYP